MATTRTGSFAPGSRQSWRVNPYEAAVGWGLFVVGVLIGLAAVGALVVLASMGALVPLSSDGPAGVDLVAAAALEQGLLTGMAAVVSVAMVVSGLGVLRSGRDTPYRMVLRVGLAPSAVVAVVGGLWLVAIAIVAVMTAAEVLLRRR